MDIDENKVVQFKVKCQMCTREISEGMLYYHHPEKGYVCEYCPQFQDGGLKPEEPGEEDEE